MNILTLVPEKQSLSYAFFHGDRRKPLISSEIDDFMAAPQDFDAMQEQVKGIRAACLDISPTGGPRLIAVRMIFGGDKFLAPAIVNQEVIEHLEDIAHLAPLHLPAQIALIRACQRQFPDAAIVLAFETSFFSALPRREYMYGLDAGMMESNDFRRYGFHGLMHAPACIEAARRCRSLGQTSAPRILSFCLDKRSEIAAVMGRTPLMVTGGMTPLEGLPGERACGELDPSIPLLLASELKWGPEQVDMALSRESGLLALAGKPTTLTNVFTSNDPSLQFARDYMNYRFLLASGQAMAAMGGVDIIVFSGRDSDLGKVIGPELSRTLGNLNPKSTERVKWIQYQESIFRILADEAVSAAASEPTQVVCSVA